MRIALPIFTVLSFLSVLTHAKTVNVIGADIAGVFKKQGKTGTSSLTKILGREERILNAVFSCMNLTPKYTLIPFGRHTLTFDGSDKFDVVATVFDEVKLKGYASDSHMNYYNGVSYLTKNFEKPIQSINDLAGKRVVTFVGAKTFFKGLKEFIPMLASYSEITNQATHSKLLFHNRADVVISDGIIFAHHTSHLQHESPKKYQEQVSFKQIFEPSIFKVYFKKKKMRDSFNKCLSKLKKENYLDRLNIEYYNELIINK